MTSKSYDLLARVLHALMACIILYTLIAGFTSHFVPPDVFAILSILNMSLATLAAPLFCIRYLWAFFRQTPDLPNNIPSWQKRVAKLTHSLMYVFMFTVFASGFLMIKAPYSFFWIFTIQNPVSNPAINGFFFQLHILVCLGLAGLISIHIFAAIKHQIYNKNNVLALMFPNLH